MNIIKVFLLVCCLALSSTTAFSLNNSSIAAIVNNEPITIIELNKRLNASLVLNNIDPAKINIKQMKEQVLYALIDEKLLEEAASKQSIVVSDQELDLVIEDLATKNDLTAENLIVELQKKQVSKQELQKMFKSHILWSKIIKNEFADNVKVSEQEIKEQFEIMRKYQKINNDIRLKLAQIVFNIEPNNPGSKNYAANIISALNSGADFKSLVREFSVAPSKENGGEIGWVQLSQLTPTTIEALKNLKPGAISKPIEQENNVMIFKVLDRQDIVTKKLGVIPTEQEKKEIEAFLKMKKINTGAKAYMSEIKQNAFVEIRKF
ncbi:MAG: Peptidyl-prolyl isomerase, parvulin family [Candidatus Midichloria mitochondrii]|nr:SurA N-terminal domain-containing protein [Candidatus Midichloria mitochondrii]MDJ1256092.1 SurA N-terminal domain-containing protein [Candidatus Midichloria mitochondrii]MDJ1287783.1 SurA N-terminal domain-containing protein [Candidatus Midichloria mitochondrii]MDJ1298622.1 SurA N-terminal domain-containing protein [Candidatus Midichloria mitochondrii]MDJ1312826.1 SurA N-terminal domain-containing protein [Candidatus Midichloria mitochondrii]MDJ1583375.1 SurA N-terminal domain-containing p